MAAEILFMAERSGNIKRLQRTAGLELPIKKIGSEQAKQTAPKSEFAKKMVTCAWQFTIP